MSRLALLVVCVAAACSKSAANQDKVSSPPPSPSGGQDVIAVPKAGAGPSMGRAGDAPPSAAAPAAGAAAAGAGDDDRFRLKPEEGTLAIEAPADVKPGAETVAKIVVTPGKGYHVNTEYPIKLTLASPTGVTLAKTEFAAGGHDKAKGDADALDEKSLAFAVKLTPAASGSYTISGKFKFAVCDHDQCLAKKENIAITVAAR
ncbi:MAG TPA: hypothetical protein VGD37_42935 [Kofleriaceae bacterium]